MGEGPKNVRDDERLGVPRTEEEGRGRTEADLMGRAGTSELGRDVHVGGTYDTPPATTVPGAVGTPVATRVTPATPSTTSTGTGPSGSEHQEIRSEIEQKRQEISETIDAIQERLSPRNVMSRAAGSVKEATMDRMKQAASSASETANQVAERTRGAASSMSTRVRENPWPVVAVAGLGLGTWYVLSRRSRTELDWDDTYDYDYTEESLYADELYDEGSGMGRVARTSALPLVLAGCGIAWYAWSRRGNGMSDHDYYDAGADAGSYRSFSTSGEQWEGEGGSRTERMRQAMNEASDRARSAADRARSAATDMGTRTRVMAGRAQERVGYAGRRAKTQLAHWMETYPLGVGAAAMAIGVAVGLALPETRREQRVLGEARDNLVEKAKDKAGEAVDRAKEKVRSVASEVTGMASEVTSAVKSGGSAGQSQQGTQQGTTTKP